ncbi:hypothetical protein [Microbacterium flavum]|uniref:D-inositol 3-phosphate glycosyltransferase n=1 Tax=Microbacterium flavum TaxID=415216 RepID=A0ABS5XY44_9MICO|nr:hypothetical protein [Microbacterium flavum]MBT8798033.1 hypothetical protein [Microbacterium flavum]
MSGVPLLLVHPGTHGVAVYAGDLARAARAARPAGTPEVRTIDPVALDAREDHAPVHVHFTDRLWGPSPEEAARAFAALAARRPVSVTLHDVPQASDGEPNRTRRRDAYAIVTAAARGVVVNSAHERALLAEEGVWAGAPAIIPLPVSLDETLGALGVDAQRPRPDGSVGVLGYFYPGKGHDEAAQAAAAAGIATLTVLGRASEGHAADLDAFVSRAAGLGVAVEVTGWLDDAEIARRARAVSVPVIAHRHVSASGSLASWIGWGRRPVAVRGRYVDEMALLRPGTLRAVEGADLPAAVAAAAADPGSTWHGLARLPMSWPDAAAAYLRWWEDLSW